MRSRCRQAARSCVAQRTQAHSDWKDKTVRQLREDEASQLQNAQRSRVLKSKNHRQELTAVEPTGWDVIKAGHSQSILREPLRPQRLCVIFFPFCFRLSTVNCRLLSWKEYCEDYSDFEALPLIFKACSEL